MERSAEALVNGVSALLLISPNAGNLAAFYRDVLGLPLMDEVHEGVPLHYENREVPRGCAHAFAALGDLKQAENAIDANAILHSGKAQIDLDPGAAT